MFLARFQLHATFSYKRVGSLPALLQIAIISTLLTCHKGASRFLINWESHDVELMVKVRKLLQSAPQIYVQLEQLASKQKLESSYKAKVEPVKKKERKDDSQANDLDNKDVSQTTVAVACAAAKEIP